MTASKYSGSNLWVDPLGEALGGKLNYRELCSKVLKETLSLLLLFLGLAGNHEQKCSKSNKNCTREQKMFKGTENVQGNKKILKGFCGTFWPICGLVWHLCGVVWPCTAFLTCMASYGLIWSYMAF